MQGPSYSTNFKQINELSGILPRTAQYIFEEFERLKKMNIIYKIALSAVEIYNENVYDLFDKNNISPNHNNNNNNFNNNNINNNNKVKNPLTINYIKNNVYLKDLIWHEINTKEDIIRLTKEAAISRTSESTQFNESSSRSHAIFQLRLDTKNKLGQDLQSFINIIDLAGSERCTLTSLTDKSKEEIEAMKKLKTEASHINKSLTTLGRIISLLADKKSSKLSLPYRESKLTMILQVTYIFF
jgi:hypothetical protein